MSEEKNLKVLKAVVISMGIVLIVGTIALFIAILQRSQSQTKMEIPIEYKKPEEAAKVVEPVAPVAPPAPVAPVCEYKDVDIPVNSDVISATTEGNLVTILTSKVVKPSVNAISDGKDLTLSTVTSSTAQQIIVYDICAGKVLSRITLAK